MGWERHPGATGKGWSGKAPDLQKAQAQPREQPSASPALLRSSLHKPIVRGGVGRAELGWCARPALPVTTSAICKEARSGRALKVLFSCQNKRQLCLLLSAWVSQLGDPDINRPRRRRPY